MTKRKRKSSLLFRALIRGKLRNYYAGIIFFFGLEFIRFELFILELDQSFETARVVRTEGNKRKKEVTKC